VARGPAVCAGTPWRRLGYFANRTSTVAGSTEFGDRTGDRPRAPPCGLSQRRLLWAPASL